MKGGIEIEIPARFRIDREQIARLCGWRMQTLKGDVYRVQLQETFDKRDPGLITTVQASTAESATDPEAYEPFRRWKGQDSLLTGPIEEMQSLAVERFKAAETTLDKWGALRPVLTSSRDAEFPDWLRLVFSELAEEDHDASLWAVSIAPRLSWRLAGMRALFGAQETPELLARADRDIAGFPAAKGLMPGLSFGYDSFVEIALLAPSPWFLGWNAPRVAGIAVELFGRPLLAAQPSGQMLDLFRPAAWPALRQMPSPQKPELDGAQISSWFRWWVQQLDQLFGILSDPSRFPGPDGRYLARDHLAVWLSIARLFLSVHTLLARPFESFERMVFFFSVLDLIEGLRLGGVELGEPRQARRALDAVRAALPADVAKVALPRCERAVEALGEVPDGFFVTERISDGKLRLGAGQEMGLERATAQWLRTARNSHHGFGTLARNKPEAVALLAAHDGMVPPELPDLAFLYLLRLMANPRRLFPDKPRPRRPSTGGTT